MKRIDRVRRILLVSSVLLLVVGTVGRADPRERFAQETGLDLDLIGLLQTEVGGIDLTLTFVFINERTFDSKISAALRSALLPYIGRNALYVNPSVEEVMERFGFSPYELSVRAIGESAFTPGVDAWVEITRGFTMGRFEVNPAGPDQGSGSEGILVLGDSMDSSRPFELIYRGEAVRFDINSYTVAPTGGASTGSATTSHEPIAVTPLEQVDTLQEILMHEEFSAASMAALLEIDPAWVRTLSLDLRGEELRMLFVRLEDPVRESALGPELVETLDPMIGTGAVMVWAFSAEGAAFSPWNFFIKQGGTNYVFFSSASFVELTEGFLRVERVNAGEVAAGVIRLPKSVDKSAPFSVYFGTSGVDYP